MTRVLVVDDSPFMASYLSLLLDAAGAEFVKVESDFERLFTEPDLWAGVDTLACDLQMPVSGLSILRHAREVYPDIRRIALTGSEGPDSAAAREVADVYLSKDALPHEVVRVLLG